LTSWPRRLPAEHRAATQIAGILAALRQLPTALWSFRWSFRLP
jgi:hypothetical protein